jgi:prepilin-type N-terminal cleavage/methylation domain-containing protein
MAKTKRFLKKKGFTIVEMLIVVIIIALLATIGIARFIGAREAAVKGTCQSQQSRLNVSFRKWQIDHPTDTFTYTVGDDISGGAVTDDAHVAWVDAGSPKCPDDGIYSFILNPEAPEGATEYMAQCSIKNHELK